VRPYPKNGTSEKLLLGAVHLGVDGGLIFCLPERNVVGAPSPAGLQGDVSQGDLTREKKGARMLPGEVSADKGGRNGGSRRKTVKKAKKGKTVF